MRRRRQPERADQGTSARRRFPSSARIGADACCWAKCPSAAAVIADDPGACSVANPIASLGVASATKAVMHADGDGRLLYGGSSDAPTAGHVAGFGSSRHRLTLANGYPFTAVVISSEPASIRAQVWRRPPTGAELLRALLVVETEALEKRGSAPCFGIMRGSRSAWPSSTTMW